MTNCICLRPSGNAVVKTPPAGFVNDGLKLLFRVEQKSSSHRTIEIAAPICGVAGAALFAWLAWNVRKHMHAVPPEQPHEKGDSDISNTSTNVADTLTSVAELGTG